jgi:hypothetical protein
LSGVRRVREFREWVGARPIGHIRRIPEDAIDLIVGVDGAKASGADGARDRHEGEYADCGSHQDPLHPILHPYTSGQPDTACAESLAEGGDGPTTEA